MTDNGLAIEIELLTGRYVATAHDRRDRAEWPPHPARLFSALVAAWADAGEDVDERTALEAFERLGAPEIEASEADDRRVVDHYVPVNDTSTSFNQSRAYGQASAAVEALIEADPGSSARQRGLAKLKRARNITSRVQSAGKTNPQMALDLLDRPRQPRTYPSVTPHEPTVRLVWTDATMLAGDVATLDRILERITRLGHSSSLVSCRIASSAPRPRRYVPDPTGEHLIRNPGRGQLAALETAYQRHRGQLPRSLPSTSNRYRILEPETERRQRGRTPSTAGPWISLEFDIASRVLPSTAAVAAARAIRGAIHSHTAEPMSERLSGHDATGRRTTFAHVAFAPLPIVGDRHADGRIAGAAVILPHGLARDDERTLFDEIAAAVGRWLGDAEGTGNLTLGKLGNHAVTIARDRRSGGLHALQRRTWNRPSHTWVSVTPIALPHHPSRKKRNKGGGYWARVQRSIEASCEHVGLPRPSVVFATPHPLVPGVSRASDFPGFSQPDRKHNGRMIARHLMHARIEFDEPIEGPLLLGAGRYFGLGLMRPLLPREEGPWPT